ncbi:MAG: CPBP family intramembrane metalloprotease [Planctomycetes bacterium]|nr:CPBP family intramembrane metalloprotease [Planctomycetota bacterium]MBI3833567.1 CPBP family intramembrane metalloprotease [Planctomycetota bacterium]
MARTGSAKRRKTSSGVGDTVARPLDQLAFLSPLILFYEIVFAARSDRVIAFDLLRGFFGLFGYFGMWAPGLAIVIILLTTHIVSGKPWEVRWRCVLLMYLESPLLAIPLLALNFLAPLAAVSRGTSWHMLGEVAQGVGAGIYEELVFRLVLVSLIMIIGSDLLRMDRRAMGILAVILSSIIFAAHHHEPFGGEPFRFTSFAFRTVAGVYLAVVFWYRGYALSAGCHAAYNSALVVLRQLT